MAEQEVSGRIAPIDSPGERGSDTGLSEFELALVVLWNTFSKWIERSANSTGTDSLSALDILVLHFLLYNSRSLRAADIAFALAIEDIHVVSYSAKKLVRLGLMKSTRKGKEIQYSPTPQSEPAYLKHIELRQEYLVGAVEAMEKPGYEIPELTKAMRMLSAVYDQAARSVVVHDVFISALKKQAGK